MKNANVAIFVPHLGCPHACSFCNQREIAGQERQPTPQDVENTARQALKDLGDNAKNAEIAFFGGSFTAIERSLMVSLLEAAKPFTEKGGFNGIRISTRPDAIDEEILDILKKYNVKSIELGAQSMNEKVLMLNGRGHTPQDVEIASRLIKSYGFELGLQMMTGLYGSSLKDDFETARKLASLGPETVRVYPTIVIEGTELARLCREGKYNPPSLDDTVEFCAELLEFFHERNITVIRLGLHAMKSLEQNYITGPWHPAFRELCEGKIYLKKAKAELEKIKKSENPKSAFLYVNPHEISKLSGQHRANILQLEDTFKIQLKIRSRELPVYEVEARSATF